MLIRKPATEVFEAFINPDITTKFWFTKSSGILEEGKTVLWQWEMYNAEDHILVEKIEPFQPIVLKWGKPRTTAEFLFEDCGNYTTYVIIKNYGFPQTGTYLLEVIKDYTDGFTTVLDGLKAYLEYGISLNLIGDKYPQRP